MIQKSNALHVGVDRHGRTWRVMDRDDSFSVYYTKDADPAHHVIYDSLDEWRDPPRVLLGRAEQAERELAKVRTQLAAVTAEMERNGRIISVLVEDAGGEVFIANGRIEAAYPITLNQDGEGRDDEVTITVLYP